MSQPEIILPFWLWLARLWPIVPPLVLLLILRGRIARPLSFLLFGSLVCFGAQWLVAQVALLFPPVSDEGAFIAEQMLDVVAAAVVQTILLSLVPGLPLLWWLYRVLRTPPIARRRRQAAGRAQKAKAAEPVPAVAAETGRSTLK